MPESVIQTDLGEYILQLDQDPPSHVVVPAIHKDRYQIRRVLNERLGYDGPETPEAMTLFIRQKIRGISSVPKSVLLAVTLPWRNRLGGV